MLARCARDAPVELRTFVRSGPEELAQAAFEALRRLQFVFAASFHASGAIEAASRFDDF